VTAGATRPEAIAPAALAERIVAATMAAGGDSATRRPVIAVDFDGTIAPIAATPDEAQALPGAVDALAALAASTAVAVISGRGLEDLRARIPVPDLHLVSEHGLRWQVARSDETPRPLAEPLDPQMLAHVRAELALLLETRAGWLIEDKEVSLAVHHRLVPQGDTEPTLSAVRELLEEGARVGGGAVQLGKAMLELRPRGAEKGRALRTVAAYERETQGPITVMMIGDDLTDEGAFLAAEEQHGFGVLVASAPRDSHARYRLTRPEDVVALLNELGRRRSEGRG